MDEGLKYFKLSGADIEANVVLAMKPEQVEETKAQFEGKGYKLEECEAPKNATPVRMEPLILNPRINVREEWDGPCCTRCKNRYNLRNDWCASHYLNERCFRFKLDR